MFKTPSVSYSFTFEYLRLSSKHSFTFLLAFLGKIKPEGFDCDENPSAPVVLLGLAGFFLQGFKLCLSFSLCNRTARRWRAASKHYFSCLVQNTCSCPPFSLLNNTGCVTHFISESELLQYLLSILPSHTEQTSNYSFSTNSTQCILFRARNEGST